MRLTKEQKRPIMIKIGACLDTCRLCEENNSKRSEDGRLLKGEEARECMFTCTVGKQIIALRKELEPKERKKPKERKPYVRRAKTNVKDIIDIDVLNKLLKEGKNYKYISEYFFISQSSVQNYINEQRENGVYIYQEPKLVERFSLEEYNDHMRKGTTQKEYAAKIGMLPTNLSRALKQLQAEGHEVVKPIKNQHKKGVNKNAKATEKKNNKSNRATA